MKHEMTFTPIDLRAWSRGEMFYYFSQMAPSGRNMMTVFRLFTTLIWQISGNMAPATDGYHVGLFLDALQTEK